MIFVLAGAVGNIKNVAGDNIMRLWHQALITKLPRQQLLGLHREVCALRGKGWGKKHSTIDYIKKYSFAKLLAYHCLVIDEMQKKGLSR